MIGYALDEEIPGVAEYIAPSLAAGLSARRQDAAAIGLPGTQFAVCVRCNDELVAMGRVVGDGGCNLEIVDIAVAPEHQRRQQQHPETSCNTGSRGLHRISLRA